MPPRPPARPTPRTEPGNRAPERFRRADAYRARREWIRYEGTGQRDLYRQLRERFLLRHTVGEGWALDLGSGPGRFLPFIGGERSRRIALDVSREMLNLIPDSWVSAGATGDLPYRVRGNALRPPLERERCAEVVVLGNTLGFAGPQADGILDASESLVSPGGVLTIEIAPAPGERSNYLTRLPASSLARLLHAPARAILARLDREGFRPAAARRSPTKAFRRYSFSEIADRWHGAGWTIEEAMAVAPCLGPDGVRTATVRKDEDAWRRLLELEEDVGRRPERWTTAAALLLAARRTSVKALS